VDRYPRFVKVLGLVRTRTSFQLRPAYPPIIETTVRGERKWPRQNWSRRTLALGPWHSASGPSILGSLMLLSGSC